MKLKVCGMKYKENIAEVGAVQPDYMGFIFYDKSPRSFEGDMPKLPDSIKKVGVFVNADIDEVIDKVKRYSLQTVQLHGEESSDYCKLLRHSELFLTSKLEIIKVFSIKDNFDFSVLQPYEIVCDYFLFDTKGKNPGGNGYVFDWSVLENYPSTKPYFLSGGIGLEEMKDVMLFLQKKESIYCEVIDVNSKLEIEAGLKDIEKLKKLKDFTRLSP